MKIIGISPSRRAFLRGVASAAPVAVAASGGALVSVACRREISETFYRPKLFGPDDWPALVAFLRSGRNTRTASFGAVNDVAVHSTQYMTDADLTSIAVYLKSLPPHKKGTEPFAYSAAVATALYNGRVSTPSA
ncbi:hypothetical protein PQQ96_29595 [Paraburkholderia sediminicola]|uniref:hypothetical protein n=1 Tax=Paraburkholderia sediminicola TaxID=458836 RepID=UPI0038BC8FC7